MLKPLSRFELTLTCLCHFLRIAGDSTIPISTLGFRIGIASSLAWSFCAGFVRLFGFVYLFSGGARYTNTHLCHLFIFTIIRNISSISSIHTYKHELFLSSNILSQSPTGLLPARTRSPPRPRLPPHPNRTPLLLNILPPQRPLSTLQMPLFPLHRRLLALQSLLPNSLRPS